MAPSFFSKLKGASNTTSNHSRERSYDPALSANASTSNVNERRTRAVSEYAPRVTVSEFGVQGDGDGKELRREALAKEETPSVTVVPPSPQAVNGGVVGLPSTSTSNSTPNSISSSVEGLPKGSNEGGMFKRKPSHGEGLNGKLQKPKSRPTTPVNDKEKEKEQPPPLPSSLSPTTEPGLGKKTSSKSLRSIKTSTNVPTGAATPATNVNGTTASSTTTDANTNTKTQVQGHRSTQSSESNNMTPIVESPTAMTYSDDIKGKDIHTSSTTERPRSLSTPLQPTPSAESPPPLPQTQHTKEGTGTVPARSQTSLAWRRPAPKPTGGLAGAIAASGLAMANPGLAGTQGLQLSPPMARARQASLSSSPPNQGGVSMSRNSTSAGNNADDETSPTRSRSGHNNHNSRKKKHRTNRTASIDSSRNSASHHTNQQNPNLSYADIEYDYSSSDSSEFSSDSEDAAHILGSRELSTEGVHEGGARGSTYAVGAGGGGGGWSGLPVTGFAVASSRRNAEFHDLFPGIPEGDYLIDDYGCALQREILIQGRLYISENHVCFHANILGWITDLSIPIYEITSLEKKMTAFVIPNAIQITTRRAKYTFASLLARDTTFDVLEGIWRLVRPDNAALGTNSMDSGSVGLLEDGTAVAGGGENGGEGVKLKAKRTRCQCPKHYTETALDTVVPGTPDKIHNLMYTSGFIKEFMSGPQGLLDIQMSDWTPVAGDSPTPNPHLLTRSFSYIKPLNGAVGPKQTKCELVDRVDVWDLDKWISTVTSTRTPDVPSGGVFEVKTRTCLMWESLVETRILVTTEVEWSGRSFIKGIIERSAIDGQKTYHAELEKGMRQYISEHQSEFIPEGLDVAALQSTASAPSTPLPDANSPNTPTSARQPIERERERNQRAWQWAWDTVAGAAKVGKNSAKGAIELIVDAWDQSQSKTILYFVMVMSILANLYLFFRTPGQVGVDGALGRRELTELRELRKELRERQTSGAQGVNVGEVNQAVQGDMQGDLQKEGEKWVQSVVGALWEEMKKERTEKKIVVGESVEALLRTLEEVEERVGAIKKELAGINTEKDGQPIAEKGKHQTDEL